MLFFESKSAWSNARVWFPRFNRIIHNVEQVLLTATVSAASPLLLLQVNSFKREKHFLCSIECCQCSRSDCVSDSPPTSSTNVYTHPFFWHVAGVIPELSSRSVGTKQIQWKVHLTVVCYESSMMTVEARWTCDAFNETKSIRSNILASECPTK